MTDPATLLAYLPDEALGAEAVIAEAQEADSWVHGK